MPLEQSKYGKHTPVADSAGFDYAFEASVKRASVLNPDKQAEIIKLAESRSLTTQAVSENLEEVKRQKLFEDMKRDLANYPKTRKHYANELNSQVSIDDSENLRSLEDVINRSKTNLFQRTASKAGNATNKLTGDLLEFVGRFEEITAGITDNISLFDSLPTFVSKMDDEGFGFKKLEKGEKFQSGVKKIGKAVSEGNAYDTTTVYDLERLKGDVSIENILGMVIEEGGSSLPHMIGAGLSMPLYLMSRNQDIAEQIMENNKENRDIELKDYARALPVAIGVALLEKLGNKIVMGNGKAKTWADAGVSTLYAGAKEGVHQIFQESFEYVGTLLGTKKEFSGSELLDRQLSAGIVGKGIGIAGRAGTSTAEVIKNKSIQKFVAEQISNDEQGTIDQIIKLSQGSTTRERKSDRFQDFVDSLGAKNRIHISNEAISDAMEAGVEFPAYITDQLDGFGTDISITVSQFSTDIASNDEALSIIREHIKLNEFTLTQSEMNDDDNESIRNLMEKANQERNDLTESEKVFEDIERQLNETNRQTRGQSKLSASLVTKAFVQYAKKTGKTIKGAYESMGFVVTSPNADKTEGDASKVELNSTKSGLSYKQDFGDIILKEKRTLDTSGKTMNIEQSAQKAWDRGVKKQKQGNLLIECLNRG